MSTTKRKIKFYPAIAPGRYEVKGLTFQEWALIATSIVLPFLIWNWIGALVGITAAATEGLLFVRKEGSRMNTFAQIENFLIFKTTQQQFIKKQRSETMQNTGDSEKKKKKKKVNKKSQKKKEKNMQEFFPFRTIKDGQFEMENGNILLFLKINANQLNFMSFTEIDALMETLGKQFDKSKIKPNFFIQDSIQNTKNNIKCLELNYEHCNNRFLKLLASDLMEIIKTDSRESNQKTGYLFAEITPDMLVTQTLNEIKARFKSIFSETLHVSEPSTEELKQMLAIFANRLFTDKLPNSEAEFESEEIETKLIRKKSKSFKDTQIPGIYDFKDLIVPVTTTFRPSDGNLGSNFIKIYTVSSFLASTEDSNLLSKISSLKGVTTTIRLEELPIHKYAENIRTKIKSENAANSDEIEQIDNDLAKKVTTAGYRRTKATRQSMYYVSILFMLTSKTRNELNILEDKFLQRCADVSIQTDPLQTMQRVAYEAINPLGGNKIDKWIKQNIPSESMANLYPFDDTTLMDPAGIPIGHITDQKELVLYNLFADRQSNQNVLVLGWSGVGKTILMMDLLQNEAIQGTYVRNIDVEGTYTKFIERLGGINIDMAGNSEFCINPLHIRIPDELRSGLVDDYVSEVKNFMSTYKSSWSERLLDLFEHYTNEAYRLKGITNATDLTSLKAQDMPLFSDIYDLIIKDRENYDEKFLATKQDLRDLLLGMSSMVKGADAKLFNRYTNLGDFEKNVQLINFDLSDMATSALNRKLAQWSNVFTYISQFVNGNMDRKKKIAVFVDEIQHFFKSQYLPILQIIESYERRFRKFHAAFIKASQTIEEFNTENRDLKDSIKVLFSQPSTKFIFHLGDIDYTVTKDLLNLKPEEIKVLKEKRQGKCLMRVNQNVYDLEVLMPAWFSEVKPDINKVG